MNLTYEAAQPEDIEPICLLCEQLIRRYEDLDKLDFGALSRWVRKKVKSHIGTYTAVFADGQKAGYYHFYRNEDGQFELDDLYIFPEFQNRGIGSAIIRKCCAQAQSPVVLYCFIRNQRALTLYKRMGFEIVRTVTDSRYIMQNDNCQRKYYAAYDERYKTAHALGVSWSGDVSTPIVMDVLQRYRICRHHSLLEIGCGEGRDSRAVLGQGYDLTATDLSPEAIRYCREKSPQYARHFRVLDCLSDSLEDQFDFIFATAVIHMLVVDDDRDGFYRFFCKASEARGNRPDLFLGRRHVGEPKRYFPGLHPPGAKSRIRENVGCGNLLPRGLLPDL